MLLLIFRYCNDSYGVGPLLSRTLMGDISNNYTFLRNERLVAYKPFFRYEGPDFFTYKIYDGQNIQLHSGAGQKSVSINEVTVHVRSCRLFEAARAKYESALTAASDEALFKRLMNHPLCPCAPSEHDIVGNVSLCMLGYESVCSNTSSRYYFLNLCVVCENATFGSFSEACTLEILRAVSFVTQRGFCDAIPPMDCSSELVSVSGLEAVNYLSIRPYSLHGSYTQLGNGMGGYGWYDSALYA